MLEGGVGSCYSLFFQPGAENLIDHLLQICFVVVSGAQVNAVESLEELRDALFPVPADGGDEFFVLIDQLEEFVVDDIVFVAGAVDPFFGLQPVFRSQDDEDEVGLHDASEHEGFYVSAEFEVGLVDDDVDILLPEGLRQARDPCPVGFVVPGIGNEHGSLRVGLPDGWVH